MLSPLGLGTPHNSGGHFNWDSHSLSSAFSPSKNEPMQLVRAFVPHTTSSVTSTLAIPNTQVFVTASDCGEMIMWSRGGLQVCQLGMRPSFPIVSILRDHRAREAAAEAEAEAAAAGSTGYADDGKAREEHGGKSGTFLSAMFHDDDKKEKTPRGSQSRSGLTAGMAAAGSSGTGRKVREASVDESVERRLRRDAAKSQRKNSRRHRVSVTDARADDGDDDDDDVDDDDDSDDSSDISDDEGEDDESGRRGRASRMAVPRSNRSRDDRDGDARGRGEENNDDDDDGDDDEDDDDDDADDDDDDDDGGVGGGRSGSRSDRRRRGGRRSTQLPYEREDEAALAQLLSIPKPVIPDLVNRKRLDATDMLHAARGSRFKDNANNAANSTNVFNLKGLQGETWGLHRALERRERNYRAAQVYLPPLNNADTDKITPVTTRVTRMA